MVSLLLDGSAAAGISRLGPPDTSGTTHRARSAVAHGDRLEEQNARTGDVMLLCSAGLRRAQRSAGDQPGRTKVSPGNAPMQRRWFSVHIPSTSFTAAGFRPPRPFTQTSGDLQAFRAR
jgi:hypothetical protein